MSSNSEVSGRIQFFTKQFSIASHFFGGASSFACIPSLKLKVCTIKMVLPERKLETSLRTIHFHGICWFQEGIGFDSVTWCNHPDPSDESSCRCSCAYRPRDPEHHGGKKEGAANAICICAKLNHVKRADYSTCTMHFEEQIDENKQII